MSKIRLVAVLVAVVGLLSLSGCGIYSFSGATVGNAETVAIHFFENKAAIVVPELSQLFTEGVREKFLNETPLAVTKTKGDWDISGYISRYETSYLAVTQDQPAKTRLNMSVRLNFINTLDEDKSFERTFDQFVDFDASQDLNAVQDQLIEELIDRLLTDIFNATVNNW